MTRGKIALDDHNERNKANRQHFLHVWHATDLDKTPNFSDVGRKLHRGVAVKQRPTGVLDVCRPAGKLGCGHAIESINYHGFNNMPLLRVMIFCL